MASSDEEGDIMPHEVSNYYFVDQSEEPISFAELPIRWCDVDSVDGNQKQVFLHGMTDNGLQKLYKQVTAWKFDLSYVKAEISVLSRENNWIKLVKPRKSFEPVIRTILITVHCLHFLKKNPGASGKSLWDHLARIFSLYDVRPSENDLVEHIHVINETVIRDDCLKTCKLMRTFLEERPRKKKAFDEVVQPASMAGFIVDDIDYAEEVIPEEEESDEEEDMYDSVCAICDNGGELLCCEGKCLRSFHATKEAGAESFCSSLLLTDDQVEALKDFTCKNCQHDQHQCFACGMLGSSNKSAGAEVFQCVSATCGHFYHPQCVSKWLYREDEGAAKQLEGKIAAGESFTCPVHKCFVCKQVEIKKDPEFQFAICRRCPKSYHKKCLPRKIAFDDLEEEGIIQRAWEGLLPSRILIYCLKHAIDEELKTPARNHIKFPFSVERKKIKASNLHLDTKLSTLKRKKLISIESPRGRSGQKVFKRIERSSSDVKGATSSKRINTLSHADFSKKVTRKESSKNMRDSDKSLQAKSDKNKDSLGDQLYDVWMNKGPESTKVKNLHGGDYEQVEKVRPALEKLTNSAYHLDADTKSSLLGIIKESASSITLEQIKKKHKAPSTHSYSSKTVVDKDITQGKLDVAVEALRAALQKLEDGCSIEDAKSVCDPDVLFRLVKWKNKLKVYLAPFLHGMRYTSYGRHFTKVHKLEEIVEKLHGYVQNGDMIVDFCCGSNDFSYLMKKKLDVMGKACFYKNYDILTSKNDFNFEQRDWMEVQPKELPPGSQLIMGLNPPFGVHAALANKFIDKALKFKPKLLILIVPQETERLDRKRTPYDLIWEDNELLSGKSFYLPGSIDENDKQMGQWNLDAPPLYLWSRRDFTDKYKAIALQLGHLSKSDDISQKGHHDTPALDQPMEDCCGNDDGFILKADNPIDKNEEVFKANSRYDNGEKEGRVTYSHEGEQSSDNSAINRRRVNVQSMSIGGTSEVVFEDRHSVGRGLTNDEDHAIPMDIEEEEYTLPLQVSGVSGAGPQYGIRYDNDHTSFPGDITGRYGVNEHSYMRDGDLNVGRGSELIRYDADQTSFSGDIAGRYGVNEHSYMRDGDPSFKRESELRSQVQQFGRHDFETQRGNHLSGPDPVLVHLSSPLPSTTYGHPQSLGTSTSAMQRYAPRLDELNHTRGMGLNSSGNDPSMGNRNGVYGDPPPRQSSSRLGFAPGPHHFSHQNSSGWLND